MRKLYLSLILMSLALTSFAFAYDSTTPYDVTMKWIIPSDTTFTVDLCGAETTIDFNDNVVDKDSKLVEPDCQNANLGTAIATITNTGNVNLNFTTELTTAKPDWAILLIGSTNVSGTASEVSNSAVFLAGDIATSGTASVFAWTNLTNAVAGTTERTFRISSLLAA